MADPVRVVTTVAEMRRESHLARAHEQRVALVPTMGYLHEGHLTLIEEARRVADRVVLSIFVNPIQFGPKEDLARYPRDLEGDLAKAASAGCDLAFVPDASEMYPEGYQTYVDVREVSKGLCGDVRPGHFVGVATVVLKLFNIVQPSVAFFGDKDYQQLQVIKRMVRDLDVPVLVIGLPTVREADGLAKSSRNAYLTADQRQQALALSHALRAAQERFEHGERDAEAIVAAARAVIDAEAGVKLQYLELRGADTLALQEGRVRGPVVLAVAAYVGTTRLIDNVVLHR